MTDDNRTWRCFFCDEVFTDVEAAHEHFGDEGGCDPEPPACKLNQMEGGLLKLYREALAEIHTYQLEDNASFREFYALGADHFQECRRAEEEGYARGLKDGKALARQWRPIKRIWWFVYWSLTGKAHPDHVEYCRYVSH